MHLTKTNVALSVIVGALLLAPVAVFAQGTGGVEAGDATSGRTLATVAAVVGLVSTVFAGRTFFRGAKGTHNHRTATITALTGAVVVAYALFHLSKYTGGLGTGDGRAGAILAIIFGLASIIFSVLSLRRARAS